MSDPYCTEIQRRLREMDDAKIVQAPGGPAKVLLDIANQVAREHPVWYERFRLWAEFTRLWR